MYLNLFSDLDIYGEEIVYFSYHKMCKFYAPCNQGLTVSSSDVVKRFKCDKSVVLKDLGDGRYQTESPDGYIFYLVDKNKTNGNIP